MESLLEPLDGSEWLEVRQVPLPKGEREQLGVFALRPLRLGTRVLRQRALAWHPIVGGVCAFCLARECERKCSKCHVPYCDVDCQRGHWRLHKHYCGKAQGSAALLLQCLSAVGEVDVDEDGELPALVANVDSFSALLNGPITAEHVKIANSLATHSDKEPHELISLLSKFGCNNFAISDPLLIPIADGVFPFAALLNHSCAPNVVANYELEQGSAPVMSFLTLRDIQAGEELAHSYVDVFQGSKARAHALEHYAFTCHCVRCSEPWPIDLAMEREDGRQLGHAVAAVQSNDAVQEWHELMQLSKEANHVLNPQHAVVRLLIQRLLQNALVRSDWLAAIQLAERLLAMDSQCAPPTHPSLLIQKGLIAELKESKV